jgi:hypothetical protein
MRPLPKRKDRRSLARTSALFPTLFCMTNGSRRTPIASSVPGPSASAIKRHYTHPPTRFCAFASRLRVRAGCISHVRCSYPRYHSPMQSVCASSRASAHFPLIGGPQYVVVPHLWNLEFLPPLLCLSALTLQLLSDVRFATKLMARSSGVATVPQSTTSLARGPAGTNLALRSNP